MRSYRRSKPSLYSILKFQIIILKNITPQNRVRVLEAKTVDNNYTYHNEWRGGTATILRRTLYYNYRLYHAMNLGFLYVAVPSQPYVPWVPTRDRVIERVFSLVELSEKDVFYDLGCGDGRVAIEAAKRYGAKAVCIEIRQDLVEKATRKVKEEGLEDLVKVIHGNFFEIPLEDATVVYMYLLTSVNKLLKPKLKRELRMGTRIITLDFEIPGWKPVHVEDSGGWQGTIYLYVKGVSDLYDE